MPRYALKIEYHGGTFAGWQRQKGLATVQGTIEQALRKLEPIEGIAAAGRTDAGVHALAQVAHVDLAKDWEPFRLCEALNFHLKPRPIAVLAVARVAVDFHARFSATGRAYRYRLISRRAPLTCDAGLAWRVAPELSLAAMQAGGKHLVGFHDFTTFRSTDCQAASPEKTLDDLRIEVRDVPYGQEFDFHVRARSFLHNQVRSLVGTLERVGAGAWSPDDVKSALDAKDRAACGPVAPPDGLYLAGVSYPDDPFQ